jgi:transposase InsO family protein
VRDSIVETITAYNQKTGISIRRLLGFVGLSSSKFYQWKARYGLVNKHNGKIPRGFWILPWEKQAIIDYALNHETEGYRRLCYQMLDEDIVAVSPSSVYRTLKEVGLLSKFNGKASKRGKGFSQPKSPHEHWHIDISYVNVLGSFLFLIAIIDGYSRYIVYHELRTSMESYDVEIVLQRALEKFPFARPRIISDNGSQFIAKDFKAFIRHKGLMHVKTSVRYPESNGKIERFFQTAKKEHIRKKSFLSLVDARRQMAAYIHYYNTKRLHSAINYLTPEDMLLRRAEQRLKERDRKLRKARAHRLEQFNKFKTTLTAKADLSNSR